MEVVGALLAVLPLLIIVLPLAAIVWAPGWRWFGAAVLVTGLLFAGHPPEALLAILTTTPPGVAFLLITVLKAMHLVRFAKPGR